MIDIVVVDLNFGCCCHSISTVSLNARIDVHYIVSCCSCCHAVVTTSLSASVVVADECVHSAITSRTTMNI